MERLPQLERELSTTQATVIALRSELDKTKNLVSSQETSLAQWQAHAKALEATTKTGQGELATAKGEVASLTKKLGEATINEKLLREQIDDMAASSDEWKECAASLKVASARSEDQHQAETIRLNTHIAEQDALLTSRNAEISRLAAELVEVKGSMAATATRHHNEAATVKTLVDSLQTDLAGVKERAVTMVEALVNELDSNPLNLTFKKYWPFLEEFKASLDEKQP